MAPGDSEVDQLHVSAGADQHVVRADVAVDDVEREAVCAHRVVRVVQGAGRVGDDLRRELGRHELALAFVLEADGHQVEAGHVLHRQVVDALVVPEVEDAGDARVVELGQQRGLVEEHPDEVAIGAQVRMGALDHAEAAGPLGEEDICHSSDADPPVEEVASQLLGHRLVRLPLFEASP